MKHACKRTLAFLLMLAMVLTMMPVTAMAAADGDQVVVQLVGKDGTVSALATWKYDGTNKTYIDLDTNGELALVKDFTDSENLKGSINGQSYDFTDLGALAYTGTNKKPDCRCLAVTTKGILIEDLYNYAGSKLGKKGTVETLKDDGTTLIFSSADNRGTNSYNYSEYWGATKYYYPAWYEGGEQSEGIVSENLQANGRIVPSTLAICGYHATTGETVSSLKEKSDDANALRNTQGQQKGGAEKAKDANMGFNSVKEIAYIKFTPTYNAITVDGGTVSGTEGDSDYQAAVTNAVVTTSDNYFKAAKGETVALTVTAESGYAVTGITVTAGENTEGIPVAKTSKNTYTFTMPGEAVALAVETGKATKVDWYGDGTAKEYTLSTKEDLQSFAAIVNGTAPGIEQDNFRGKTVKLAKSIALDADNKYTYAVGTFGSSAYPMADAPYYTINEDAEIWTPIGKGTATSNTDATTDNAFAGTFDGCGYTVSGVYTGTKDASAGNTETVQGFFGVVTGTVKNLTVSGCITGKFAVGGIVASLNGGTVEDCINNAVVYADGGQAANSGIENGIRNAGAVGGIAGNVMTGSSVTGCVNNAAVVCTNSSKGGRVGGIIGLIDDASAAVTVKNNGNKGRIDAYQYSGGIVGYNNSANAPIENCYNNGDIFGYSSGRTCVGGIVSTCKSDITNCYNTGDIEIHLNSERGTKAAQFGGIVADFGGTAITNCYNTGELKATGTAAGNRSGCGAICGSGYGSADENKMVNCYSLATVTDTDNIAGNLITVKSAEEMKAADFIAVLCGSGRAFVKDAAKPINGGYPVLRFQTADAKAAVWDGTVDVSWYNTKDTVFTIKTPAQLAGLAAIVNGVVLNDAVIVGNKEYVKATAYSSWYAGTDDFAGKTIKLAADLDMGGVYNSETDTWSGPYYQSIGGQFTATEENGAYFVNSLNIEPTEVAAGGSFLGTFDGAGHYVKNIYCKFATGRNSQSVGFIGRLGAHDNDVVKPSVVPSVKNVAITGYIEAGRSVGGIVGKVGKTGGNPVIENCANYASVTSTDHKGIGGICGAAWNGSVIRNCYNAGAINGGLPAGGICGGNEGVVENCYNIGRVASKEGENYGVALGTRDASSSDFRNSYALEGSATYTDGVTWGDYGALDEKCGFKTEEEMKTAEFVKTLGSAFAADKNNINNGYPVLAWQNPAKPSSGGSGGSGGSDVQMPSVTAGAGGKTSLSKDGRTLTITPDEGYEIASVTLNGTEKGTSGTLTGLKTGDKVVVVFQKKVVQTEKRFNDVNDDDWFNDAVNYAADKGLMTGTGEKTFSPYSNTTRAMLMTILARMSGEDTTGGATWYQKGLEWAVANGVSDGTNPEKNITREQLAVMLYRYAGSPDTTGSLAAFKDADSVSDYAKTAVKWAVEKGIITGKGGGMLDPKSDATRAEMAAMLQRYCQLMEK